MENEIFVLFIFFGFVLTGGDGVNVVVFVATMFFWLNHHLMRPLPLIKQSKVHLQNVIYTFISFITIKHTTFCCIAWSTYTMNIKPIHCFYVWPFFISWANWFNIQEWSFQLKFIVFPFPFLSYNKINFLLKINNFFFGSSKTNT